MEQVSVEILNGCASVLWVNEKGEYIRKAYDVKQKDAFFAEVIDASKYVSELDWVGIIS